MGEELKVAGAMDRRDTPADTPIVINLFENPPNFKTRETPEAPKDKPDLIGKDAVELSNKVENLSKELRIEQPNERIERLLNEIKISLDSMENQLKRSFLSQCQMIRLKQMAEEAEREERFQRRLNILVTGMNRLSENDDPTLRAAEFIEMYFKLRNCVWSARVVGKKKQTMVIRFRNIDVKNKIMKESSVLKGTNISIWPHLTLQQRILQERLKKIALEAQELGKTVKVGYNYLIINGEKYAWNQKTSSLELEQY